MGVVQARDSAREPTAVLANVSATEHAKIGVKIGVKDGDA
jgi:hypothetical protein